jgi:hypothetical protein
MRHVDKDGNIVVIENNKVLLKLANEDRTRTILVIKDGFLFKTVKKSNLIKGIYVGFNYEILKYLNTEFINSEKRRRIYIQIDRHIYLTTIDSILEKKIFLWFKKIGFERQVFIDVNSLELVK